MFSVKQQFLENAVYCRLTSNSSFKFSRSWDIANQELLEKPCLESECSTLYYTYLLPRRLWVKTLVLKLRRSFNTNIQGLVDKPTFLIYP